MDDTDLKVTSNESLKVPSDESLKSHSEASPLKVGICIPSYAGGIHWGTMKSAISNGCSCANVFFGGGSLLACGFNDLFLQAVKNHCTHFVLLHSDISIEANWLKGMMEDMERLDADVLSAVIPIKDDTGETSTAIAFGEHNPRLPMVVCKEALPSEFCIEDCRKLFGLNHEAGPLLVNSGVLLIDLRKEWVRRFPGFEIRSGIDWTDTSHWVLSEDWLFSRWVAKQGAKVYATSKYRIHHHGIYSWCSDTPGPVVRRIEDTQITVNVKSLVDRIKPESVGVEVGVWRGATSEALLDRCEKLALIMVDPWKAGYDTTDPCGAVDSNTMGVNRLLAHVRTLLHQRFILSMASETASKFFEDEVFDFVFIDACHRYEDVLEDLKYWWPKVKPGGFVACHDYGFDEYSSGVTKAVNEFYKGRILSVPVEDTIAYLNKPAWLEKLDGNGSVGNRQASTEPVGVSVDSKALSG